MSDKKKLTHPSLPALATSAKHYRPLAYGKQQQQQKKWQLYLLVTCCKRINFNIPLIPYAC
jgi:hypothetical protein